MNQVKSLLQKFATTFKTLEQRLRQALTRLRQSLRRSWRKFLRRFTRWIDPKLEPYRSKPRAKSPAPEDTTKNTPEATPEPYTPTSTTDLLALLRRTPDFVLTDHERQNIIAAINFPTAKVSDLMLPRADITYVKEDETLGPLTLDRLYRSSFQHFPVQDATGKIIGVIHTAALNHLDTKSTPRAADLIDPELYYLRSDYTLAQALAALKWPVDETIVAPLGARGSKRTFWRLSAPRRSAIAIAYETEGRAENARYAACAKALAKAHVAVPKVLLDLPNLLVMEDLGDDTFDRHVAAVREDCLRGSEAPGHEGHRHGSPRLRQVMELLATFHRADIGDLPLEPPFDAALYAWEVSLHEQFAKPFPPEAKAELARIQDTLLAEPAVLVHRDFQSSNILWNAKRPWLIDFQGMRRGPALYDLASFLYDPYVDWGEAAQEAAIGAYAEAANRDAEELRAKLPFAGIQRLTQAIGAYHRLASVGQPRFLTYVPIARARAAALAEKAQLPALATFFKD